MKKLKFWIRNAQRQQSSLAIEMLAKRWRNKMGSELLVLVLANIKEGNECLARQNVEKFQLIAKGLSKEDTALLQSALAGLQGTSWDRFSAAIVRAMAITCCKYLLGSLVSWLLALTHNYRSNARCFFPSFTCSIVRNYRD